MKRIRLTQPGWENYTGALCGGQFVEGLSEELADRQAAQVANIVTCEDAETGFNPSSSQHLIDSRDDSAEVVPERTAAAQEVATPKPERELLTREGLEEIALKRGINGIREISNPMGVRSTSINTLIELILQKQAQETGTKYIPLPVAVGPAPTNTEPNL